jgi:hypothetical protein
MFEFFVEETTYLHHFLSGSDDLLSSLTAIVNKLVLAVEFALKKHF